MIKQFLDADRDMEGTLAPDEERRMAESSGKSQKPSVEVPTALPEAVMDFVRADEANVERYHGNPDAAERARVGDARLDMEVAKMLAAPDEYLPYEHMAALKALNRRYMLIDEARLNFTARYGGDAAKPSELLRIYRGKLDEVAGILSAPMGPRTDEAAAEQTAQLFDKAGKVFREAFGGKNQIASEAETANMTREEKAAYAKDFLVKNGKDVDDGAHVTKAEITAWWNSLSEDEKKTVDQPSDIDYYNEGGKERGFKLIRDPEMMKVIDEQMENEEAMMSHLVVDHGGDSPEAAKYRALVARRNKWIREQRMIDRLEAEQRREKAFADAMEVIPFMNAAQKQLVAAAADGRDMGRYAGVFKLMDAKTRRTMEYVCGAVKPEGEATFESGLSSGIERQAFGAKNWLTQAWYQAFMDATAQDALKAEHDFQREFNETVGWDKLKTPSGFWQKATFGFGQSLTLTGTSVGGGMAYRAAAAAPHPLARFGLYAAGTALEGMGLLAMTGDEYENLTQNGVRPEDAVPLAFSAGIGNWMIENMNTEALLGTGLSPSELMRIGLVSSVKAGVRCFSKREIAKYGKKALVREWMQTLRTNAAAAFKFGLSECAEEFFQGIVSTGAVKYGAGEKPLLAAFLSPETVEAGAEAFAEAIPTCTLFGIMGAAFPAGSRFGLSTKGAANQAFARMDGQLETLLDEKVRLLGLDEKGAAYVANEKAKMRKEVRNKAAQVVRASDGMAPGEAMRMLNAREDMTPGERAYAAEMLRLYEAAARV